MNSPIAIKEPGTVPQLVPLPVFHTRAGPPATIRAKSEVPVATLGPYPKPMIKAGTDDKPAAGSEHAA